MLTSSMLIEPVDVEEGNEFLDLNAVEGRVGAAHSRGEGAFAFRSKWGRH